MSQTLLMALRAKGDEGTPLPDPIPRLAELGVKFRRGQLSLIAGAPGGGKTALASWISAVKMRVPTMYFSADADRGTMAKGILAGVTGSTQDQAEWEIENSRSQSLTTLSEATKHIWWSFDTMPSLADIEDELDAYAYVYGEYPWLVVIDNLMDIAEGGDELSGMSNVQLALKGIARRTDCHMMVLAHVVGAYTDGTIPIPRSGMMWKPDKKAELILTIFKPAPDQMGVRVVKNRSGMAATDASHGVDLAWWPQYGRFSD